MPDSTANINDFTPDLGSVGAAAAPALAPRLLSAKPSPASVEQMVRTEALKQGLPPDHLARLAKTESGFNSTAASQDPNSHAYGVMQLQPSTAKEMGVDPQDLAQNIHGGVKYYKQLLDRFGGDHVRATAAYHDGPTGVENGNISSDGQTYVKNIMGIDPGQSGLQLAAMGVAQPKQQQAKISDFQPEQFDATSAIAAQPQDETMASRAWQGIKTLGGLARPFVPDIVGAVAGGVIGGPPGVIAGGMAAATARAAEQAALVQQNKIDPTTAKRNIMSSFVGNMASQTLQNELAKVAPVIANAVYRKLGGVAANDIEGVQAVADMVERKIPAGIGRQAKIDRLKGKELDGLNSLYDKYGNLQSGPQVPGLVRTGAAGSPAAQQGASMLGTPTNSVNKNAVGVKLLQYLQSDPTIPKDEIAATAKSFDNFLGRMPEDMSLNDVRKVMNNVSKKVPFGDPDAAGKMLAQKNIHHFLGEEAANAISDPADKAAFIAHKNELERLINIENLQGFQRRARAIIPAQVAAPAIAAAAGGATGYYTHQDPKAAALRGALFAGAMGATFPSAGVNLLQSPTVQALLASPIRHMGQQTTSGAPGMTPEDVQRMRVYLNANQ